MKLNNQNTNFETLETIANDAIEALNNSNRTDAKRWQNAIKKAVIELQVNPYWNYSDGELIMMSTTSNETYYPNGKCGCISYTKHNMPCRHRASKRLLEKLAQTM